MCMWCTATRNLQRPELDWRNAYHFNSERDALVFTADPISTVQDPPLSFVHSITACGYDGKEHRLTFSPENEETIEAMIEAYKSGISSYARMTVHVHLSMASVPASTSSLKTMSKRGRTAISSDQSPSSSHPSSSNPLPPPPPHSLVPSPPITLSTSAMNATFVYPRSVIAAGGRKTYMGASSGTLSKPSDVWKVFNPALCRNEEMPRLLVLRECVCVQAREARNISKSNGTPKEENDNTPAAVLRRGTFDVGSVDYRGHFDYSYSAWFVRPVGRIKDRGMAPASPAQSPPPLESFPSTNSATTTTATLSAYTNGNGNAPHPRTSPPPAFSSSSPLSRHLRHSHGQEKDQQLQNQGHIGPRRFRSSSSSGGSTIIEEIPPPPDTQAHTVPRQHRQLPPPLAAPVRPVPSGYAHTLPPPLRRSRSRSCRSSRSRSPSPSRSRGSRHASQDELAPATPERRLRYNHLDSDHGHGQGQRLPSIRQITGEMDQEEEMQRGRRPQREYEAMEHQHHQQPRDEHWREPPVRMRSLSSTRTESTRTSPIRSAAAATTGGSTTAKVPAPEPRLQPHPHPHAHGHRAQAAGASTLPPLGGPTPPHAIPLPPQPQPSAKLLNNFGPRRLLMPPSSSAAATPLPSSSNSAISSSAQMHPHPLLRAVDSGCPASSASASNGPGSQAIGMVLPPIAAIHVTAGAPLDHPLVRRTTSLHELDSAKVMSPPHVGEARTHHHHRPPPPSSFHFSDPYANDAAFSNGGSMDGQFQSARRWSTHSHEDEMDVKPDIVALTRRSSLDSRTRTRAGSSSSHPSRYLAHPHATSPSSASMATTSSATGVTSLPHPYDNASIASVLSVAGTYGPGDDGGGGEQRRGYTRPTSSTFSPPLSPPSAAQAAPSTGLKRPRERDFGNDPDRPSSHSPSIPPPRLRPVAAVFPHPHPHHAHLASSNSRPHAYPSNSRTSSGGMMPMSLSPPMSPGSLSGSRHATASIYNSRYGVEMSRVEKNGSSLMRSSPDRGGEEFSHSPSLSPRSLAPLRCTTAVSVKQEPTY